MNLRRIVLLFIAAAMSFGAADTALGESPWQKLVLFRKVESDPDKEYRLTQDNGPWLIMAVTFSGEHAEEQAKELVHVIRKEYKLPAYMHEMEFDYTGDVPSRRIDQFGMPVPTRYRVEEVREIGVLVGDYPTIDDREAQQTLERLKYLWPACMEPQHIMEKEQKISRPLAAYRLLQQYAMPIGSEAREKGPMGHAFMITNPLLPREYYAPRGLDKLVVDLNRDIEHSLLNCPGRYSVRVASFNGTVVLDQAKIKDIERGMRMPTKLEQAAMDAHKMCAALRAKGYEAYEYHDRTSSIVTVGSFDSVGTPRADGKIEINPQIHRIMQTFGADRMVTDGQAPQLGQAKSLVGIPFDIQPLPVEVPKNGVVVDYDQLGLDLN